jgi:hypothetical protein
MVLNTFHLPSGFEFKIGAGSGDQQEFGQIFGDSIHPNFDFAARYTAMEPALGKQARAQQLVQMAGMWQENPWVNQYQFTKLMMELLDIREADYLLKQPQQFAQEMQQQVQQQMMMKQQEEQFDAEGKIAKSRVDSEGRLQVTDLKGQYDLAVAAIGHDAQVQAAKEKPSAGSSK